MTITLYDIASALPQKAFSVSPWKTRHCINLKKLPYKTVWVEFPDIEPLYKKLGLVSTENNPDGSPAYLLPIIHDSTTGTTLNDSWVIAEYLEKTYPDRPSIFPHGSVVLQSLVDNHIRTAHVYPMWAFIAPAQYHIINPESKAFFRASREAMFGTALENAVPTGEKGAEAWAVAKATLSSLAPWFEKTEGPFIMGHTVSWGDLDFGSVLIWYRTVWGEDSKEWKDIASLDGGRWEKLLADLEEYRVLSVDD